MSVWQSEEQRCAVVLREVFGWLGARELARAGAACRAWRRAAAEPALWRRLLRAHHAGSHVAWRQEFVCSRAGWSLAARHRAADTLLHAALAPAGGRGPLLALAGADASLAVWRREEGRGAAWREEGRGAAWREEGRGAAWLEEGRGAAWREEGRGAAWREEGRGAAWREEGRGAAWREVGRTSLRARGWRAAARAQWAGRRRLLLAGPLALVADWELLVLQVEEDGRCGAVASRVRCSAGAAGCWADATGDAFLSFELHRLGAGLYCTTVWLNAATQETESEYAGVTSPLLRIYNEDGAHLTHALVASQQPGAQLVAGAGCRLGAWVVSAPRPPPLVALAGGALAERVRRQRLRRAAPAQDAPEPDEAAVRAICTPPAHLCRLAAPLVGLVLHESGRSMWAVCSDGSAACVSVAALQLLLHVRAPGAGGAGVHYVQPAASASLVAWPAGGYSARVEWLAAASGARGAALVHDAAAVCCVLPRPDEMLVLAGDALYVWRSRATPQWDPRDAA